MYCPTCGHLGLLQYMANRPVADFFCEICKEEFELKAKRRCSSYSQDRIVNGAYATMINRITSLNNPHLLYMKYYQNRVLDMQIIPKFFFVPEIIEKRNPLSPTARRACWVGCNINVSNAPKMGRINIISNGLPRESRQVVDEYQRVYSIKVDNIETRSWMFNVLRCIEHLQDEFTLRDVYGFKEILSSLHPNNNNVEAKIRQQLQRLRDKGFIEFSARGLYRKLI